MDVVVSLGPDKDERLRLSGVTPLRSDREPKTYVSGRVCEEGGCSTILSRYNRHARCWQHEPTHQYLGPVRGRPPAEVRIRDLSALSA